MSFFTNVWEDIKLVTNAIMNFLKPFIERFLKDEVKMLIPLAIQAVKTVAGDPNLVGKDWQTKLSAAVNSVKDEAVKQGIQVATTDIINVVQAAYSNVIAETPVTP